MAIGDTWETINTYSFVAGETIITADYENDVVNNLQFLYQKSSPIKIWVGNTNTAVTCSPNTNGIDLGWSVTFTPGTSKVAIHAFPRMVYTYLNSGSYYMQLGYKVNSGSIVYIDQKTATTTPINQMDNGQSLLVESVTVNENESNTIAFYLRTGASGSEKFWSGRAMIFEAGN